MHTFEGLLAALREMAEGDEAPCTEREAEEFMKAVGRLALIQCGCPKTSANNLVAALQPRPGMGSPSPEEVRIWVQWCIQIKVAHDAILMRAASGALKIVVFPNGSIGVKAN